MDDDLPPDLVRLGTLESCADLYLTRIRTRMAAIERQQARPPQAAAPTAVPPSRPAAGPRRARPPDWGLGEAGIGGPVTEVHRGDCWARGRTLGPVSAERARAELVGGARNPAGCADRPDPALLGPCPSRAESTPVRSRTGRKDTRLHRRRRPLQATTAGWEAQEIEVPSGAYFTLTGLLA